MWYQIGIWDSADHGWAVTQDERFRKIMHDRMFEKGIKQLGIVPYSVWTAVASTYPISDFPDQKGHKMGQLGAANPIDPYTESVRIPVTSQEAYIAIAQGIIDGIGTGVDSVLAWRLYEVAPYVFIYPVGYTTTMMWFNMDRWNSFPADIQDIIENQVVPEVEVFANGLMVEKDAQIFEQYEEHMTVTFASPDVMARARNYLLSESESYQTLLEQMGPDVLAIFDEYSTK
jgi:TRAP-type C4-dicarboxylate transport system substrate-binding protein